MGVRVIFECGGCNATAEGTDRLRKGFRSFSGRPWGFGHNVNTNTVEDIAPPGWTAYDPYTYCTYCPECWADIERRPDPHEALNPDKTKLEKP